MNRLSASSPSSSSCCPFMYVLRYELVSLLLILCFCPGYCAENQAFAEAPFFGFENHCHYFCHCGSLLVVQVSLTFFGDEFGQQFAEVGTGVLVCVACWLLFEGEAGGADDPVVPT